MGTLSYDDPPAEDSTSCPYCSLIPMILEKVNVTEQNVAIILQEILGLKGTNTWEYQWKYELTPNFTEEELPVHEGTGKGLFGLGQLISSAIMMNTDIHKDLSAKDGAIAVPEHWQIPLEAQRPQLVLQSAEKLESGVIDSAKYVTCIPHYKYKDPRETPPFDYMDKGSTQGMLVLKDNSKVIIYAKNQNEATRVINKIKETIKEEMLENSYVKLGQIKSSSIKTIRVYPKFARYYETGIKEAFKWQQVYRMP